MIGYEEHLLPRNATHLEQVLSSAGKRVQAIPTPIETVKGPYTAPASFLTFDAWEYSVDLWKSRWSETKKRTITASWFFDHSIKGTQRAIARYVGYVGSELLKAYRPPGKAFASPSFSPEEREAWMRTLPQIKIWDLKQRGRAGWMLFASSAPGGNGAQKPWRCFAEMGFTDRGDAAFRLERRATMTLDGVETQVDVDGLGNQADRVRIRGKVKNALFSGGPFRGFPIPSTAAERIITFTFKDQPSHGIRFPVRPGLEIKSVIPELVYERGHNPFAIFAGSKKARWFAPASTAHERIYSRVAIFDRQTRAPSQVGFAYSGVTRIGMPQHTAEVQVSIPGKLPARAVSKFLLGHLIDPDREKWNDTFIAVRAAKRLSDRVLVNTKTYRPLRLGTTLLMGGRLILGRWTRS